MDVDLPQMIKNIRTQYCVWSSIASKHLTQASNLTQPRIFVDIKAHVTYLDKSASYNEQNFDPPPQIRFRFIYELTAMLKVKHPSFT